ncbi:hypothetical protein UPYG_G00060050 [Umbra pygmaea]|uniref:Synaptogyrin n=1 Tax=Umbra pygmaea TaxID=75934 RepID=A0ABD0X950_UMBPY
MEETGGAGATAYGASLAGGSFDLQKFVKQPQTIVRILSWIFSIVVFACITTEGYVNPIHKPQAHCVFNENDSACHYAVGVGIIAFLGCFAFFLLDAYLPMMSNAKERKIAVMADLGFSGLWTFLWFVCFCLLASQWGRTEDIGSVAQDAARATIAFSFFSIATWGILTYFALGRYRRGLTDVAPNYTEPLPEQHMPYPATYAPSAYIPTTYSPPPSSGPDNYLQPPYTPSTVPVIQTQGDYKPPTY